MNDKIDFLTDIITGMDVVNRDDGALSDPLLLARIREYESVRNRGAVEARLAWTR